MKKYLIKREIQYTKYQGKLNEIGQGSESVLKAMRNEGKQIEQEHIILLGIMFFVFIMQNQKIL